MAITITANDAVRRALETIGIAAAGQEIAAEDYQLGRERLAEMVDAWNIQALTVLAQERTVYDLVANQGGPDNPYTIGPGGDFDTGVAPRPVLIRAANLLLNTTSPYPTQIPLAIITDQMNQANQVPSLVNAQPQTLYYRPTVPLGEIQLWNIPNTAVNQLVLYTDLLTPQFDGSAVAYVCPPGYAKAFRLCLAKSLLDDFQVGGERAQKVSQNADEALMDLKCANAMMDDLAFDPAFIRDPHGTYIIQTDTGA